ncbi:MAG: pyridoxal-phosphate dependent enzyme [Myxococcales bacterium]|nr:pyridoxal-phosphate dependent enzyme [Myxococcales bacterium]
MQGWRDLVDTRFAAEQSALLRYHRIFDVVGEGLGLEVAELVASSLGEGIVARRLADRGGVEIFVADETTAMCTGTYKALDACVTTAALRRAGVRQVVASSGGNLSAALGAYCQHAGIEALLFQPVSTLFKQDRRFFGGCAHLIGVDLPEPEVKSLARAVARAHAIAHIPDVRLRTAASAARAMFLLEAIEGAIGAVDFLTQTVCAGFGPAGIYTCFAALRERGLLRASAIPRLITFQQAANSPMVRAWQAGERELSRTHIAPVPERYIEPGLYNTNPGRDYDRLAGLMRTFGGDMLALADVDYDAHADAVRAALADAGIALSTLPGSDEVLEKTGLLTGVGIYRAIDAGLLQPGERVIYMLTGGRRDLEADDAPLPELVVDRSRSEEEWVAEIGARFGLGRTQVGRGA